MIDRVAIADPDLIESTTNHDAVPEPTGPKRIVGRPATADPAKTDPEVWLNARPDLELGVRTSGDAVRPEAPTKAAVIAYREAAP